MYDDSYEDYDTNGNGLEEIKSVKPQRKATKIVGPVVQLTQRYVAPYEDTIDNNNVDLDEEERSGDSDKKVKVSLLDFDIFPTLRPPPISSDTTRSTTSLPVFKDPREKQFHRDAFDQVQENSFGINTLKHQHNSFEHGDGNSLNSDDQPINNHNDQENPTLSPASTDGCPGNNLRTCVEACVPLPQLWIYVVCVKECVRRCP